MQQIEEKSVFQESQVWLFTKCCIALSPISSSHETPKRKNILIRPKSNQKWPYLEQKGGAGEDMQV